MRHFQLLLVASLLSVAALHAQPLRNAGSNHGNRFEQLDYLMQDPNEYRTASGAPGPKYCSSELIMISVLISTKQRIY